MKTSKYFSILFYLLLLSSLSTVEFIFEHIDNKAKNLILIPYNDFFFQIVGEEKTYDNNISIIIYSEDDQIAFQNQFRMNITIDPGELNSVPHLNYNREYYPLQFETDLEPGVYQISVVITDSSANRKRELKEFFDFPVTTKNFGNFYLGAKIDEFIFIIRDRSYLSNQYDSLQIIQNLAIQPDSTFIVLRSEDEFQHHSLNDLSRIQQIIREETSFSIEIEHFYQGRKYVSSLIYPNAAYFFQQKYNPKDQLAQLRYIISQNEYQYLRSLSDNKLQNGINEYWLSKDPDPYTTDNVYQETFYQRIRYVDNHYQIRRYLPGWRTDMGRIYIIYGEPDQIISDIFPIGRSPSITWYYYGLNKVFIFYDLRGYGNYELRNKWMD